jgi:transposase InsO family protein
VISRFVDEHRARFGVESICRVPTAHGCKIAPRTYYAHKTRPPAGRTVSDAAVVEVLRGIVAANKPERLYGCKKMWPSLRRRHPELGTLARCTVQRLMKAEGIQVVTLLKRVRTTIPHKASPRAADQVDRNFTATEPNRLRVADFTYATAWADTVYVAFAVDVLSQIILGWRVSMVKTTDLVLDTAKMAMWRRDRQGHPVDPGLVHHSDAGSQYTSIRFAEHLALEEITLSIGSVGDAYDNAMMESIIGRYKTECIRRSSPFHTGPCKTLDDVEYATLAWVDRSRYAGDLGVSAADGVRAGGPSNREVRGVRSPSGPQRVCR